MLQRVVFINKNGQPYDMVLDIVKKDSKFLRTINPEDGQLIDIPRKAVESISDPELIKESK
jgi:hypothetical protein